MTSFPSLKEPLTLEQLKTFRENFEITFAEELNGPDWHGYYTTYSIPDFSLSWTNETEHNFVKKEFVNYSYFLTGEQDPKKIDQKLLETEQNLSKNPGQVYRVTPTEEAIERGERLAEEQKIQSAESKASAEAKTQEFIKLQKRVAEEIAIQAEVDKATAEQISANYVKELLITKAQEKLYFNLPKKANVPELSSDEETKIKELIEEKVKPNPTFYTDSLAKEIVKQNKTPEMSRSEVKILKANAKLVAINHTNNLLALESKEETIGNVAKLACAKNPIQVAVSLANPENPIVGKETAKSAQITALTLEHDNLIARNLLSKVVDPKTLSLFYPGANELIVYEVSDKENKETVISVDRKAYTDQGIKLEESNNQVFSFVKENLWGEIKDRSWGFLDKTLENTPWYSKAKSLLPDFLKPNIPVVAAGETVQPGLSLLWSKQGIQLLSKEAPALFSSSFGKSIFLTPNFGLQFGKFVTTEGVTGQFFGINFGDFGIRIVHFGEEAALDIFKQLRIVEGVPRVVVTGGIGTAVGETGVAVGEAAAGKTVTGAAAIAAKKTAGGVAGGILGKVAAKLGLSAALANIGAALGAWAGPVGIAVSALISWVAGKILEPILIWIKKHQEDLKIVGLIMLGGGVLVNSIPVIVVGGLIFIPVALRTGFSMAGIAARTAFLFGRIGASMAITIGAPIIVAIIVFPILVAIILFIINSGAYIVPPSSPGLNFESPYIGVDKTANPPGPFQNSDLPLTIEYAITITAKKGTLTNIHFSENCQVIKKGASVNCPSITGGIPQPPESISPTTPFSFKYSVTYAAGAFADSLVVNSFTVTADAAGVSGVKGVGSTSIKIGNPPEDCPNNAWPIEGNGGLNAVNQGPSAPGCTHQNLNNAIDIGVDGATVVAVHSGIVTIGDNSCEGKNIKISSTCGSVPFSSFYAHLGAVTVSTGQKVSVGQAIGISDNTGSCTSGPHLHFSFQTSSIPKVQRPYLIRDIPIGCCTISTCNP